MRLPLLPGERPSRLFPGQAPGDAGELARVAEALQVQKDDLCPRIFFPILDEIVARNVGFVADAHKVAHADPELLADRQQELRRLGVEAVLAHQPFEHGGHGARVVTGFLQVKNAYAVSLPAMQTLDARLPVAPLGVHALYDRRLGLSDAANASGGTANGVIVTTQISPADMRRGTDVTVAVTPGIAPLPNPTRFVGPSRVGI